MAGRQQAVAGTRPASGSAAPALVSSLESRLRSAVSERLGPERFDLWFGEGVRLGLGTDADGRGESVEVGVPNAFFREWIQGHFAANIVDAAAEVTGKPLRLTFRIEDEAEPQIGHVIDEPGGAGRRKAGTVAVPLGPNPGPAPQVLPLPPAPPPPLPSDRPRLRQPEPRPARRLDGFVTGPNSRLAHAAALEMVGTLGASFNPLVIHGGVGLGKTHLLEAIGQALRSTRPGMRVVHVTAEGFTNGFLEAMRTSTLASFRSRFRGAEALIVDDVHFLAAKRATQDEFLHTFNALVAAGVPIVLACDQHPRTVPKLTEELATRFAGGMVVKLEAPDPATRKAILKAKALARGVDVPDAVLSYVAEHLRASVRELEGALHSLLAHALLTGKRVDLNLARSALRDTIRHTAQAVALKDVERAVCGLFQVEPEPLKSASRTRALTFPRMLAMYLARKHTGAAYSEIGRFFGGRNHSTVISAEKKVASWLSDEKQSPPLAGFETVGEVLAALERELGA